VTGAAEESGRLVNAIRTALAEHADPVRAPKTQAYMKSSLPFYAVPMPTARKIFAAAISAHPLPDRDWWQRTILTLWNEATHREERYAALALAEHRLYRPYQDPAVLPLYERLVVTGAWWDLVDDLATHKVAPLLRAHHAGVAPVVLGWSRAEDLWLRRTAILAQIGAKTLADHDLLAACIEPNLGDSNFFIRKAIGWALRDLARTDPEWVRTYVEAAGDRMSGLSRREALKHL
jgi:3-methyladenine DNA glycosylase AlkD